MYEALVVDELHGIAHLTNYALFADKFKPRFLLRGRKLHSLKISCLGESQC